MVEEVKTFSPNTAYLGIDGTGRKAVVANHAFDGTAITVATDENGEFYQKLVRTEATVELFEIKDDGRLGKMLDVVKHEGRGSGGPRQGMPHPHCAVFNNEGTVCAVCDKGTDSVYMYRIDKNKLRQVAKWDVTKNYMPRYSTFHPSDKWFYHNNEGNGMILAYEVEGDSFKNIGEYCVVNNYDGELEQQGMVIHPNGKFLYDAVKGPECISVLQINQKSGELTVIQNFETNGRWIRGIEISPDGNYLIATFFIGNEARIYKISEDGTLSDTGYSCIQEGAAGIAFTTQ